MPKIFKISEADTNYIWDKIQALHLIYHLELAPKGIFDRKEFESKMFGRQSIVMLDRNIFTLLLNLCENGSIPNYDEATQKVGLVMIWAMMHGMEITPGYSVQEYATKTHNEKDASLEIQQFKEIMAKYTPMDWFALAQLRKNYVEPYTYSGKEAETTIKNAEGSLHYYMAYAAMVHLVRLHRDRSKPKLKKILDFHNWVFDNIATSAVIFVYATLVLLKAEGISPPHGAEKKASNKVIDGCENQAWDLTYLANWFKATLVSTYPKEIFFASADKMLGNLLSETLAYYESPDEWYNNKLTKKEYAAVNELITNRKSNRVSPLITVAGLKELIKQEIEQLTIEMRE